MGERFERAAEAVPAPAFSFVMAAGIVSVSVLMHGPLVISRLLLAIAALGYLVLIVLTGRQLARHPGRVRANLAAPHTRFGYATFVAASGVLGTRLVLAGVPVVPVIQLVVAVAAWLVIAQQVVGELRRDRAPWWHGVDGSWFLSAVASHSIGVLAASIAAGRPGVAGVLGVVAVVAWCIGVVLYGVVLGGVITRVAHRRVSAENLTAPYWITMGACAITVLDSAKISVLPDGVLPALVRDAISYAGLGFWVLATALIPLILAAGWWRHAHHRVPLDRPTTLWSIVFPLGMYDVASTLMATGHRLRIAELIGDLGVWIALAAWAVTIALLLWQLVARLRAREESAGTNERAGHG